MCGCRLGRLGPLAGPTVANTVAELLGVFVVAFFLKKVGGSAVFWAAVSAQALVLALFFLGKAYPAREIGYLWLNPIGCLACVVFSLVLQAIVGERTKARTVPAA